MLRKLLRLAAGMGIARSSDLAQALGVSPPLVQQMLEALVRDGYLKSVVQGYGERCPLESECLCCATRHGSGY